ncbi:MULTISPECIES: adenylosuccinate lyase [Paenibacillus]|jgi:adenylosuccinate lyase|uniref:Adenylosuccinate lyase n=1 Tax=Paenibacillus allorhizoplanae TaxID=2905648 RepID=A0ABN8H810_9BACL|nr:MULTISPECIES: adenylosuccinate lyase [Paenibacillus]KRE71947.1 adenylosuccinate lyase [Paenibacillus sp. Soil750]NQX62929.1 adenylosuccinate lyase [Paenibacillus qinlingensis]CAH1223785.1 Adenylosuccinate lyase [Paenibacillus allorhizoplanae]
MIERYTRPEMARIWTEENKFNAWLEVEILSCEAWSELGVIPKEDVKVLREKASFNIDRIYEIEQETRHDVIAFTRAVSETLGPERKWVHYGLTSTDVVDTALGYLLRQANEILDKDIQNFIEILRNKAIEHRDTAMMGRTHGVHAEPTTFGLKMALWYEEMKRNLERFRFAADGVQFGKISGAVGTYANIDPFVEEYVCGKLGTKAAPISTQTLQRDRHAEYMATLALVATSLDKFATEIRALQKSEFREVEEPFAKGQKGSSAMPHKRNPIGCESISGLSRVIRGHMVSAYENVTLWHERDISHSSVERIILPDATQLLNYMLNRLGNIIKNLTVFPENMKRNMRSTYDVPFSGRVMTKLIDKGFAREQAYDTVQPRAMQAWEEQRSFREIVENASVITEVLSPEEIADCFDPSWHLKHVSTIFDRLGLN